MAAYIGSPGPFDSRTHKWSSYQTQFEHFLKINDIKSDSKQTSCLIALIGTETYTVLEGLTFPDKPADMKIIICIVQKILVPLQAQTAKDSRTI